MLRDTDALVDFSCAVRRGIRGGTGGERVNRAGLVVGEEGERA